MWFLVVLLMPKADDRISASLAQMRYPTFAACMKAGVDRTEALASIKLHGRYSCMYHGEPDRDIAKAQRGEF